MQFESAHEYEAWPDDMSIRVSDGSNLLELLWLRHHAVANAEPSLPAAALPGDPIESPDNRLVGLWEKSWKDALEQSRRLQETDPLAIPDRTDLWTPPDIAPFAAELGLDASNGAASWRRTLAFHDAERATVARLRGAWGRGLRVVLEVPLGGPYARPLSTATLLISSVTRRDVAGYSEALDSFGRR